MSSYVISCCSTADLLEERFIKREICYICFHYELDGVQYMDDLGKTMPFDKFYEAMRNGADTKTSQINVEEYCSYFEPFLKEGKDILHVTLSSGISGALNSAMIAKDLLEEKYPDRKIYVVDSLGASAGYGLLMDRIADLRDEGYSLEELYKWTEENKLRLQHWFFSTDLTFFIKGGRISKTSGFVGGMLGICPLMHVDREGKLIPRNKIRGKSKVIRTIVDRLEEYNEKGTDYDGKVFISNSDCIEDAQAVEKLIRERFPKVKDIEISSIGTTIGSHTGPGTVAMFFWGKER